MDYELLTGNALDELRRLPDDIVNCCITSPPYWLQRNYQVEGQLGQEITPDEYVHNLVEVFEEVRRVLTKDGTLWIVLGDTFAATSRGAGGQGKQHTNKGSVLEGQFRKSKIPQGLKQKDLVGVPWRVAFALQAAGWYLRSEIVWQKPNCMPDSVRDRPTKAHETIFLLAKSPHYYYDADAIKEPHSPATKLVRNRSTNFKKQSTVGNHGQGNQVITLDPRGRNKRSVWTVPTKPTRINHFASYPPDLIRPCVLAGCPPDGLVLDPFSGTATTGLVALANGRRYLGIELNPDYQALAVERLNRQ